MRVETLKRWHWALIGCFLGLVVSWAWGSVRDSGGFARVPTVGAEEFQRLLGDGPIQGHPRIKDITLHQDSGHDWVTMKVLRPDPKDPHPKNPRRYRYVREQLNATTPFMPDFRQFPSQTVMIRVNPSVISKTRSMNRHEDQGAFALWVNGAAAQTPEVAGRLQLENWKIQTGEWADPEKSAEIRLPLRPANYDLMIVLSTKQDKPPTGSELMVKLNGHEVPLSGPAMSSSGLAFKGKVAREFFAPGEIQSLQFSRAAEPIKLWEVRLIDPTYSVADYLAFVKQSRPDLGFGSAWWERGWTRYALCALAGAVLFAVFAPLLVVLFLGSYRRVEDPAYDLDRFKGEPAKESAKAESPEELDLSDLEAKVSEGLEPKVAGPTVEAAAAPPPPAKLSGDSDRPAPIQTSHEPEEYQGEYYPVARPHKHD